MSNFARPSRELHTVGLDYTEHLQTWFPNKTYLKVWTNTGYYIMKFKNYRQSFRRNGWYMFLFKNN